VNRINKHDLPKQRVAARLRRLGLPVRVVGGNFGYDLVVGEQLRVTLRVAFPSQRRHRVTVSGRTYQYRYRTWHFNFHQHGRLDTRYTDFFVCLAVKSRHPLREDAFIIPWDEVTGKTFSLHGGQRDYSGRYAPFRERWALIAQPGRRTGHLKRVA
jgi:hypothetical protein